MRKMTKGETLLTKELVKELADLVRESIDSIDSYPDLISYWADNFEEVSSILSSKQNGFNTEKIFIPLAELFFYDFIFAHRNGYLIEGGYKLTWKTRDKRVFLDTILNANYKARNSEECFDTFLQSWEAIFASVDFNGYDIEKILKDVFENQDVILNDSHLLDSDYPNECEELNAMYEMQNAIRS